MSTWLVALFCLALPVGPAVAKSPHQRRTISNLRMNLTALQPRWSPVVT
jgi:hypothetical protein